MAHPIEQLINNLPPEMRSLLAAKLQPAPEPIAIIGVGCRFPGGATTPNAFWQLLASGQEAIGEIPAERWDWREYYDPDPATPDKMYTRWGGFLGDLAGFDNQFFGIAPGEALRMDPQQRLLLEVAWEALENAGQSVDRLARSRTGIYIGIMDSGYNRLQEHSQGAAACRNDPYFSIGSSSSIASGRLSYILDLQGPNVAIDTACSSSLVATHLACQALRSHECDLALAGGVNAILLPDTFINFCKMNMLAADGRCKTFDASADGFVMGEGCGVVALKRLSDALRDGDPIIALIRGSAVNEDGRSSSQTAPNGLAQQAVVRQALKSAGVQPQQVQYVEAHGSGTALGDPIEIEALGMALTAGRSHEQRLRVGALKTSIGHLVTAAGIGGLIKTALSLHNSLIPPSLNLRVPNPGIPWESYPLEVPTQPTPWPASERRIAGVSSFGWSGTNAHAILEAAPERPVSGPSRPYQLLLLSAKTETALDTMTANLGSFLADQPQLNLGDVAYTLQVGRSAMDFRRAVVCHDPAEAAELLTNGDNRPLSLRTQARHAAAFVFPGVGDHYAGMARDLYEGEPLFREIVDRCCTILNAYLHQDLREVLYPAAAPASNGSAPALDFRALLGRSESTSKESPLHRTDLAQPSVFVIEYALAQLLISWGLNPQAMLGYSLGEYVAACVSGVLSLEDALHLVAMRAQLIQQQPAGAMLAVAASESAVQPFLGDSVCLAAVNSPTACVLAGPPEAIAAVSGRLDAAEIANRPVETTHAFHSTMLTPIAAQVTALARNLTLNPPQIPYISNVTGTWITAEQAQDPAYWARHMTETVRFADGVGELLQRPELAIVEVGPGQALASFVRQHPLCDRERRAKVCATLPAANERQDGLAMLLAALGRLWMLDVPIDWSGFYTHEERQRIALPTYPFEHQRFWIEPGKRQATTSQPQTIEVLADLALLTRNEVADSFYLPSWQQRPPQIAAPLPASANGNCWLIFADECGIGETLARWLQAQDQTVVTVRQGERFARLSEHAYSLSAGTRDDYANLLRAMKTQGKTPAHVIYAWPVTADAAGEHLKSLLDISFYGPLYLGQALSELDLDRCRLSFVSNHVQRVTGYEPLVPAKATVIGPCRSLQFEHPGLRCRAIDLVVPDDDNDFADLLANLVGELTADEPEIVVALRDHRRWVQTIERMPAPSSAASPLRSGGVYLITGGLGGIGLALAEHLAQNFGAKLALVGRSALPPRQEWPRISQDQQADANVRRRIQKVQELEALGAEVLVLKADVADAVQMRQAVQQTLAQFGALHGVIHAAGVPGKGLAALKTATLAEQVFAPKIAGTLALAEAVKDQPLDFLALCSSILSISGGSAGQIDYTAANAFLDAFAQANFRRHGTTIAIGWGEWQWNAWDDAMDGYDAATQEFFRQRRRKYGLSFAEGAEAFERALARRLPSLFVSTDDLHGMIQFGQNGSIAALATTAQPAQATYSRPNLATSYVAPRSEMEQLIADVWSKELGIADIGINDNFFDLGGNSLLGMVLLAKLRKRLNIDQIPSYVLFEAPSIGAMAHYFDQRPTGEAVLDSRHDRGARRREKQAQRRQPA
ncbi:MAG: SDR family NAD(P)-dependent oxidoreductase [Chloroflexi bacterium]|nr:SDR family NAD(P)-dependent oxidoreductase [Chloroflexota bacterium]